MSRTNPSGPPSLPFCTESTQTLTIGSLSVIKSVAERLSSSIAYCRFPLMEFGSTSRIVTVSVRSIIVSSFTITKISAVSEPAAKVTVPGSA
ncbi:MAG: hypothetical protein LBG58_07585 [Planctomycetaceae bacterium]|nr:hypothetical protein [Planctomycetaceae bacterium]